MNKTKRKALSAIETRLSSVKDTIEDIKYDLDYELSDEEESLERLDRFSGTDRYAAIEEAIDNMNDAMDSLEDVFDNIDSAIKSISKAKN